MARQCRLPASLFLLLWLLAGCVSLPDPEVGQEQANSQIVLLEAGRSVGQTFRTRHTGLNLINLWLGKTETVGTTTGSVTLRLYRLPDDPTPLREVSLPIAAIQNNVPFAFSFPALQGLPGAIYYLELSSQQGGLIVFGRDEDIYPHGSAYIDGRSIPADLAFSSTYEYNFTELLTDLKTWLTGAWLLLPLAITLILPGWLLTSRSHFGDPAERLAFSLGLSLAIIPIILTWTTFAGLRWSRSAAWVVAALLLLLVFWRVWLAVRQNHGSSWQSYLHFPLHLLLLLLITVFSLGARLVMVRDLAFPPWVDSVHHAVITRLIMEQGAFPASYAPLINIDSASYHAGYHAGLAYFTWLSGMPLERAMLLYGQVLNALIVPAIYLLAVRLGVNRWGAVFAGLIAGIFTPMPAYYTSWGRYTQLAGLLILPVVFAALQVAWSQPTRRNMLLAGIAGAGLFLTHYRVAAYLAVLLAAWLAANTLARIGTRLFRRSEPRSENRADFLNVLRAVSLATVLGVLFVLPWLPDTFRTLLLPKFAQWSPGQPAFLEGFALTYLTTAWGKPALWLAALGLGFGLARQPRFSLSQLLWVALLIMLANPSVLGLPGNGLVNNTAMAIMLFMPTAVSGGYFLGELHAVLECRVAARYKPAYALLWLLVSAIAAGFAVQQMLPILRPLTFLGRAADRPALEWIAANLPPDQSVLINPGVWGYGLYQGVDGGFWISALTDHPTLPPPVLYGLDNDRDRLNGVNSRSQTAIDLAQDPVRLHSWLKEIGIRYVYIGVKGGLFSARRLLESGLFTELYAAEGAWVLRVEQATP